MAKSVTINATEELHQAVITFKGGVAVETQLLYRTVEDGTGAVVAIRKNPIMLTEAEIAADAVLAPIVAAILTNADAKIAAKDAQ